MSKVEIKVNVINQLKLFKQSTFKDRLCFLDEDIQNAQRAKAKNVWVDCDSSGEIVIIANDGKILDDPQSLFSIAESGWDNDVMESENPFGMGFFSNITVSDMIEIHSGNKYIKFDVNKMIQTNNTDIEVSEIEDYYDGFKLILKNFKFESGTYSWEIKERVNMLGKYIQELDVYYNDELQEKKDLTEDDGSVFSTKIDEEDFKGWISLNDRYYYSNDRVNIFYKGRLVQKLDYQFPYLQGDIHINDKTLNLTSPDRKDVIRDEKFDNFKDKIRLYAEQLCEEAVLYSDDEDIEKYAEAIGKYIDMNTIKNKIKFVTLKGEKDDDIRYIKDIAKTKKKDTKNKIKTFKGYQIALQEGSNIQDKPEEGELTIEYNISGQHPSAQGVIIHESSRSYNEGYTERPEIKDSEIVEKEGEQILNGDEIVFWMKFSEIEKEEEHFNMVKYYKLKLIIARNKVEEKILTNMKETHNVLHISELKETVRLKGTLSNMDLNRKEQRALMLFDFISRTLEFDNNVFTIGDLLVTKTISVDCLDIENEIIEENIVVLREHKTDRVYVDRSIIDMSDLNESIETDVTISDYKFILTNIYNIAEEVSFLKKGMTTSDAIKQIVMALGQGKL